VTLAAADARRRARVTRIAPVRLDAPMVRLLGLLVGVGAALPLGYVTWRTIDLGWSESWTVVSSARTRTLLGKTLLLVGAVTAASSAIAITVAWLTTRTDLPARRFWTIVTALPLAIPTYVGSFAMIGALGPRGMVQGWLEPLGVERIPSIYGFGGAFAVLTLFTYPYVLLPVRAAFRRLDPSLDEASRTLGRGPWTTFFRVVLPQVRPAVIAGALLVALYTLSDFGAVSMLRYDTFTRAIYVQYRGALNRNSAAVLGLVLVAITTLVLTGEQRFRGREQVYRLHGGGARAAPVVRLGRLRWVAAGSCAVLSSIALAVPLAVIAYWLWRGAKVGESLLPAWSLVGNSLLASALGAVVTMMAAWPIALLSVRHRGRFTRFVEKLSWSGHALPGVVVALALVFFGARYVPWAYQTLAMLVFAYVVLFLPQALAAIRGSLVQITPSMEEASFALGASRLQTFRRITLPLTRSGVLAAVALVFLTCMKELPATLLLAPTEYGTLATRVWTATAEAFFARAAAPALALVLLSSLPMAVLVLREADRNERAQPGSKATVASPVEATRTR
jgi:iron(III) transport system permease protein